jgi:hypothetical protein
MGKGLFDGVPGESLFDRPMHQYIRENDLPALFKNVEGMNDARLLAVVTALLVEDRIDKLHTAFFPKYEKLLGVQNYTFSMKITLLEALEFIPLRITRAAHVLRKVRNEFAHNLLIGKFEELSEALLNQLSTIRNEVYASRDPDKSIKTTHQIFKQVSFYCIGGMDAYMFCRYTSKAPMRRLLG